jgi:hypothetical protein
MNVGDSLNEGRKVRDYTFTTLDNDKGNLIFGSLKPYYKALFGAGPNFVKHRGGFIDVYDIKAISSRVRNSIIKIPRPNMVEVGRKGGGRGSAIVYHVKTPPKEISLY